MQQRFIPLSQLFAWEGNVRATHSAENIDQLAASIAANGLLQPLVVRQTEDTRYMVIAGRRRLQALHRLSESGTVAPPDPVSCTVISAAANLLEVSLTENVTQLPMHPADRFTAFRALADQGMKLPDIAARFGISESFVYKLLKLGNVSDAIMNAYRENRLDYEQVQAFTVSDNHEEQDKLLQHILQYSYRIAPSYIRKELVKDEIPASDRRVKFIGLEFYEMCGGTVRRDLFDDSNSGYVQDKALLSSLVESKAQSAIDQMKAEGWGWAEFHLERDWQYWNRFRCLPPQEREFTPEEQEEWQTLNARLEEIDEQAYIHEDEDAVKEMTAINDRLVELEKAIVTWSADTKAASGVLIALVAKGELEMDYGMVKREATGNAEAELPPAAGKKDKSVFSASLLQELSRHRTAALQAELAANPRIALVAVVHALVLGMNPAATGNCVKIHLSRKYLFNSPEADTIPAVRAIQAKQRNLGLPDDAALLWDWLIERDTQELHRILATCAAFSVNAVIAEGASQQDIAHSCHLAKSLGLDMRNWFTPTSENCFSRMSKAQILDAFRQATGVEPSEELRNLKKQDLATRAEREIADTWLPAVFLLPEDTVADPQTAAEAEGGNDA